MSISLIAVFILVLHDGRRRVGRIFNEFGMDEEIAIVSSAAVSLTSHVDALGLRLSSAHY